MLRADIVARTGQPASHGWVAVRRDLGRGREWVGDGELRINRYDRPTRVLSGGRPAVVHPGDVERQRRRLDQPVQDAIYYPVAGRLAATDDDRRAGLDRLIGANRAALLCRLDQPPGTTDLTATSGPDRNGRQPPAGAARRGRCHPPPVRPLACSTGVRRSVTSLIAADGA